MANRREAKGGRRVDGGERVQQHAGPRVVHVPEICPQERCLQEEQADCAPAPLVQGKNSAKRRREQQQRSQARHVAWLSSLCRVAASHHTGSSLLSELQSMRRELDALRALVHRHVVRVHSTSSGAPGVSAGAPSSDARSTQFHERIVHQPVCVGHEGAVVTSPMHVDNNASSQLTHGVVPDTATTTTSPVGQVQAKGKGKSTQQLVISESHTDPGHAPSPQIQKRQSPSPAGSLPNDVMKAPPAFGSQSRRFQVGDRVKGNFGTGCVTYIVPTGFPNAGDVEVDGDGRCDVFSPAMLTWDMRSAARSSRRQGR